MEYEPLQRMPPPPQNKNYYNGQASAPQSFNNKNYPIRKPMPYKPYYNKDGYGGRGGRGGGRRFYNNNHAGPNYGPPGPLPMEGMNPHEMNYRNGPPGPLPPHPAFDYYGNPLDRNGPSYPNINPGMHAPPPNINSMIIDYGSSENDQVTPKEPDNGSSNSNTTNEPK